MSREKCSNLSSELGTDQDLSSSSFYVNVSSSVNHVIEERREENALIG